MVDRVDPPQAKFDDTIEDLRDHQIATLLNYLRITKCRQLRSACHSTYRVTDNDTCGSDESDK